MKILIPIFWLTILTAGSTAITPPPGSIGGNLEDWLKIDLAITKAAIKADISKSLWFEICRQESSLRWWVRGYKSNANGYAWGLCQVQVDTASEVLKRPVTSQELLGNIELNALAGALYFRKCLERFGSIFHALTCYNAGPGKVDPSKMVNEYKKSSYEVQIFNRWKKR